MTAIFTRAFWRKLDDFDRVLMGATAALFAMLSVYLVPVIWNAMLNITMPGLVGVRELLLVALHHQFETPQACAEAFGLVALAVMILFQMLNGLLAATIRVRTRARKDGAKLKRYKDPLLYAAFGVLVVVGWLFCATFIVPGTKNGWTLGASDVTTIGILGCLVYAIFSTAACIALAGAEMWGDRPTGAIQTFTRAKILLSVLYVAVTWFALAAIGLWVAMVVFDLMLAPLDDELPVSLEGGPFGDMKA